MVVGLGNPGRRYKNTRHNLGWEVVNQLSKRWQIELSKRRFQSNAGIGNINHKEVILVQPTSFVNLSGEVVLHFKKYYKVILEDILIICDDFNLPLGKIRMRPKGSSGGHKGLASIISRLGTNEFPRLRLGIGPVPEGEEVVDFVLDKFKPEEKRKILEVIKLSADAVYCWIGAGIKMAMNKYNSVNLI